MAQDSLSENIEILPIRNTIHQKIRTESNIEKLLDRICLSLTDWTDVRGAWLVLTDRDLRVAGFAAWGEKENRAAIEAAFKIGYVPACLKLSLERREAFILRNPEATCGECPLHSPSESGQSLIIPLIYDDILLGVLYFSLITDFTEEPFFRNLLNILSEDAAYALWAIRLREENHSMGRMYSQKMQQQSEAVISLNEGGIILSFNEQAESILHVKAGEVLGKGLEFLNNSFLYQKWLVAKKSLENIYTYIIPEIRIDKGETRFFKVFISRVSSFPGRQVVYYITFTEIFTDNINRGMLALYPPDDNPEEHRSDVRFEDLVDLDQIAKIQKSFAEMTGLASIITGVEGIPLLPPSHFSEYCSMIRKTEKGSIDCIKSDTALYSQNGDYRIYRCQSGGLLDSWSPIIIDGRHVATWLVGQAREMGHDNIDIKQYAGIIGADPVELQRAYNRLPQYTYEEFNRRVAFLNTIMKQQVTIAYQNLKQREFIEKRKDFIKLLTEREEFHQGVLRIAPIGIAVLNDRFQFTQVNDRVCSILGYSQEELINRASCELFDGMGEYLRVMNLEADQISRGGFSKVETVCLHKNGSPVNIFIRTVRIDPEDRSKGYVLSIQDITEEKKNAAERDILFSAVDNSSDSIFITDAEGNIIYVNSSFEKLTGYTFAEASNRNPRFLNSGTMDPSVFTDLWQTVLSGKMWNGRLCNRKKDGTLYTGLVTITPVINHEGAITNFVSVKRDITEQLKIEEENRELEEQFHQAQKEESIGRLAGGIAHDLNNMLTPILGYSELLIDPSDENGTRQKRIQQIYEAGERARKLVKQLLTFSRRHDLDFQLLNLNTLITNFSSLLQRTIKENISFTLDLCPELPMINADSGKIEQILMNLAVNSQDAMPGGGSLVIKTGIREGSRPPQVCLSVHDTGCGIEQNDLDRIMEPFFSTKGDKGTGLGLANVQRLVKQHKGRLDVSSRVNQGTVVTIQFPSAEKITVPTGDKGPSPGNTADSPGETVLLVEDDAQVRAVASSMLTRHGLRVLSAESAETALQVMADSPVPIPLLLTDVVLQGKNGFDLYHQYRTYNPEGHGLFMSGYLDISAEKEYQSLEDADFIQKPLQLNELINKVTALLGEGKQ